MLIDLLRQFIQHWPSFAVYLSPPTAKWCTRSTDHPYCNPVERIQHNKPITNRNLILHTANILKVWDFRVNKRVEFNESLDVINHFRDKYFRAIWLGFSRCLTHYWEAANSKPFNIRVMMMGKLFTHVPHSSSSINWYWPKDGDGTWKGDHLPSIQLWPHCPCQIRKKFAYPFICELG